MGCATSRLPSSLEMDEYTLSKDLKYNVIIGVEKYKYPAYSENLINILKSLDVFRDVVYVDEGKDYNLVAKIEKEVYGESIIPILTIITFGIIPTIVEEYYGIIFSINERNNDKKTELINASFRNITILGWIALPMGILPQYSLLGRPETSTRYKNRLKYLLCCNLILKECAK